MPRAKHYSLLLVLLSFIFLAINPTFAKEKGSAASQKLEQALKERANSYWNYRMKSQFEKSFKYEDPASVKGLSFADYARRIGGGVRWLEVSVDEIAIDKSSANVLVKVRYVWTFTQHFPKEGMTGIFRDQWKLANGKWLHIYQKPLTPPTSAEKKKPAVKATPK